MKRIVLCAGAALLALSAQADWIANDGTDSVRLTEKPCALDIPQREVMLAGSAVVAGEQWVLCWAPVSLQHIRLVYEDGDVGLVNIRDLMPAPEA